MSWRLKRFLRLRTVAIIVVMVLLVLAARWTHWTMVEHRLAVICEGYIYQSAVMPAQNLVEVVQTHEIRSVVDLRNTRDDVLARSDERVVLSGIGVAYFNIESNQIPSDETVERFLKVANDPDNYPMLIHCHHGVGRSLLFAALHRIESDGWGNEDARKATKVLSFRGAFGPRGEKGEYLRAYQAGQIHGSDLLTHLH